MGCEVIDVEFTLALNNKTGKYYFCRDLIKAAPNRVGSVLYWRVPLERSPTGLVARILGRLALIEIQLRRRFPLTQRWLPLVRRVRPLVFMDPREVIFHELKASDCVICHDVGPITHPELYHPTVKETYEMAYAKIRAAKLSMIFVTKVSMREFVALYGKEFRSMTVIPIPLRTGVVEGPEDQVEGVRTPFLLTVGSLGARKNQVRSIEAFRTAGLAEQGYRYVLCGGPEPGVEEVIAVADATPGVMRLGYVSDTQLRWLYRNAVGFVLPSLLEGFGLPAAEAIAYGLVPLVGRGGALHEVTGDEAILVDPTDVDSIAEGLKELVGLDAAERDRRLRGLTQSAKYLPEDSMRLWRETIDRIEEASDLVSKACV
jgi:glycosyltransferase involved in cell wall biosynthesis